MLERLFLSSLWIAAGFNVLAYVVHYFLTRYELKLYCAAASKVVTYEGAYETPPGARHPIGWRLVLVTMTLGAFTAILWWVMVQQLQRPDALMFLMGGWLLLLGMLIIRDLRQITLFRYWRTVGGSKGSLRLSERLMIVTSSTDYQVFAGFFLFLLLITGDLFFLGGAFTCFAAGRHRRDGGIVMEEAYPRARASEI
ncbi:MAG TPA: hypothetical protein VMP08_26375 [Anaerolineae bacterium]|nr:hypothetical protein [Anaerolineae bacterium]